MLFGNKLRESRAQRNRSRQWLAQRTGLSAGFLGDIEHGKSRPPLDMRLARAAADALKVQPFYFISAAIVDAGGATLPAKTGAQVQTLAYLVEVWEDLDALALNAIEQLCGRFKR